MNTTPSPWQDSCSSITDALSYMLNHEIVVDAIFKKDKISCLYAHKLVLSIWSPKFADWIEERDKREVFSTTFEEDEDVLKTILQYLYCPDDAKCFAKMPMEKLEQALEIAERFDINHVYKKCLNLLRRKKISPLNVIVYFDYGLRKNFTEIVQKCVKVFEQEGINANFMREDFSMNTFLALFSLNKIAVNSEADLLNLAISWLSYPDNKHYKFHVLSFIDLQSISFIEYQDICNRYPNFFSDDELSSIILSQLRKDPKLLPKWYQPKMKTVVEKGCTSCIDIHQRIKILKPLRFLKMNKRKDLKSIVQEFEFEFQQFTKVQLLNMKLNFGPGEISPNEIALQYGINRTTIGNEYSLSTTIQNDKYVVIFKSPLSLTSKDTLILKFNFRRGLLANNIYVVWPIIGQEQKINSFSENDAFKVKVLSSKLAFYAPDPNNERFIVSSFHLNACDSHRIFLSRRCHGLGNISSIINLDSQFKSIDEGTPNINHVKKEINDVKMEIDDTQQNCSADSTLKDVKPRIKMEFTNLDSSVEEQYTSFQILPYDRTNHIKQEVIDLTDGL